MRMFEAYTLKNLVIKNRIVLPPMDTYSAGTDGYVVDRHQVHYGARAVGGVGLIILEAKGISPLGRISNHCLGLWEDGQIEGLEKIVHYCKSEGAAVEIQINHAGRKSQAAGEPILAPSPLAFSQEYRLPKEMSHEEIKEVQEQFRNAAERANQAGFDLLEIHGAHGYLISEFLSPLTNKRSDEYGGNLNNRCRFLQEVLETVREVWPIEKPLSLRVSATDYREEGMHLQDMVEIIKKVRGLVDIVHVSSGGVAIAPIRPYPGYQVGLAEAISQQCKVPVIAVGLITTKEQVEEILGNGRADLVAMGRELFRNPNFVLTTAREARLNYAFPEITKEAFPVRSRK